MKCFFLSLSSLRVERGKHVLRFLWRGHHRAAAQRVWDTPTHEAFGEDRRNLRELVALPFTDMRQSLLMVTRSLLNNSVSIGKMELSSRNIQEHRYINHFCTQRIDQAIVFLHHRATGSTNAFGSECWAEPCDAPSLGSKAVCSLAVSMPHSGVTAAQSTHLSSSGWRFPAAMNRKLQLKRQTKTLSHSPFPASLFFAMGTSPH